MPVRRWHAHAPAAIGQRLYAQGIVDFGESCCRRGNASTSAWWQIGRHRRQFQLAERGTKIFQQKGLEMVIVRMRHRAATLQQAQRRQLRLLACLLQRLEFERILVRLMQWLDHLWRKPSGNSKRTSCAAQAATRSACRRFFSSPPMGFQRIFRRGLVAPLYPAIEDIGAECGLQTPAASTGGAYGRNSLRQLFEAEFVLAAAFPQEMRVDIASGCFRQRHEFTQCRALETQQHVCRLDLERLPRRFDLQRGIGGGHDHANP